MEDQEFFKFQKNKDRIINIMKRNFELTSILKSKVFEGKDADKNIDKCRKLLEEVWADLQSPEIGIKLILTIFRSGGER